MTLICPQCGCEYVPGITECADCHMPLVDEASHAPRVDAQAPLDLQVVFTGSDGGQLAIAKSLLMAEGIEFSVVGEGLQDLFGYGRFPGGSNLFMGPARILVSSKDAEDARALLGELQSRASASAVEPEDVEKSERDTGYSHLVREGAKIGAALVVASFILELFWGLAEWLRR